MSEFTQISFLGEVGVTLPEAVLEIFQQLNRAETGREVSIVVEVVRKPLGGRTS